ncbi:uncharacterized protein N7496_005411 [Penicillium cataractarum]|uniref:Uncharacterized protein n=1 Tax=Penicillium cataractarum TaxID=2100454 RepID=A0A9W9SH28_9EURO|nr:uncharacterized protein N7496_005411 [Penicillium cataractarum]KAJ5378002.1 hypothetical protein N7496_005411 [Penicillium cataractarum]
MGADGVVPHDGTRESEPSTVDSTPLSAYPLLVHSKPRARSVRAFRDGDQGSCIQKKPSHVTEEELVNEVRQIYAGLVMVEKKCIELDKPQTESRAELSGQQWQAMISLHRTLLQVQQAFFLASQYTSATLVLKRLARKYKTPARMWRYGTHPLLELLRQEKHRFPSEQLIRDHDFLSFPSSLNNPRFTYQRTGVHDTQESESRSALSHDREVRVFDIPCQLAGHSANVLGDYAAERNFMDKEYALHLGLRINWNASCNVTIGSGKQVTTVGTAMVPFSFKDETEVHNLEFELLPTCVHNVIIGKPFLKLTKTFSNAANFHRRVKERVTKGASQFHLLYLGASTPMVEGSINGQVHTALADSGSRLLLMDEAYAHSLGVYIHTGPEYQTRLTFADNSTTNTAGIAYDVNWCFGRDGEFSSPYPLNFHILKNAPADIILSGSFLFDTKAFLQYHHYFTDNDDSSEDEDRSISFFAIDFDRRKKGTQNITSFSLADLRYLELVRRGEEADRLSTLLGGKRTEAQRIEDERCAEWDLAFEGWKLHSGWGFYTE